jgi:hypothetical protein
MESIEVVPSWLATLKMSGTFSFIMVRARQQVLRISMDLKRTMV